MGSGDTSQTGLLCGVTVSKLQLDSNCKSDEMGGNQILPLREKTEILYVNIKGQRGGLASEGKTTEA